MTVAIIVGILALAIAPLFWAMPSRRERQLAALRTAARKRGFTLQVTEVDHPDPTAQMQVSAGGKKRRPMQACVAYRLQRPPATNDAQSAARSDATEQFEADMADPADVRAMARSRLERRTGRQAETLPAGWGLAVGFEHADPALCALASGIGEDVLALESTSSSVAVFWLERGGEARLAELEALLRLLMTDQAAAAASKNNAAS